MNKHVHLDWKGKQKKSGLPSFAFYNKEKVTKERIIKDVDPPSAKRDPRSSQNHRFEGHWTNRLIQGDNRYIMAALLPQFTRKIDLVYIDPPFATGGNFSYQIEIGDVTKTPLNEANLLEEVAYRDTWGKGM